MPPLSEEARRALTLRQAALTALTSHPSWPDLEDELSKKEERIKKTVLAKTLGGTPIDVLELHYLRGFLHGMRYVTTVPVAAEGALERYLKKQGIEIAEEAGTI